MISTDTEGERVMSLISSIFHDVKYQGFRLVSLRVVQTANGDYTLEFIINNNGELVERQRQKKQEELEAVQLDDNDENPLNKYDTGGMVATG